jgi:hypothetical protein
MRRPSWTLLARAKTRWSRSCRMGTRIRSAPDRRELPSVPRVRIKAALAMPGRPGIRVIAKQLGGVADDGAERREGVTAEII